MGARGRQRKRTRASDKREKSHSSSASISSVIWAGSLTPHPPFLFYFSRSPFPPGEPLDGRSAGGPRPGIAFAAVIATRGGSRSSFCPAAQILPRHTVKGSTIKSKGLIGPGGPRTGVDVAVVPENPENTAYYRCVEVIGTPPAELDRSPQAHHPAAGALVDPVCPPVTRLAGTGWCKRTRQCRATRAPAGQADIDHPLSPSRGNRSDAPCRSDARRPLGLAAQLVPRPLRHPRARLRGADQRRPLRSRRRSATAPLAPNSGAKGLRLRRRLASVVADGPLAPPGSGLGSPTPLAQASTGRHGAPWLPARLAAAVPGYPSAPRGSLSLVVNNGNPSFWSQISASL